MPEVNYVTVQIGENRIVEGWYTVVDGEITMTYPDGEPVMVGAADMARKVQRRLAEGENPRVIAGRMTREIRTTMAGENVPGFWNPIDMQRASFA